MFELFARKLPKVSGNLLRNSRFLESRLRDRRINHYAVGRAVWPAIIQWRVIRPFHVALYDPYIRENQNMIEAVCSMNGIPYEPTGENITPGGGGSWRTFQFAKRTDAIRFWDGF